MGEIDKLFEDYVEAYGLYDKPTTIGDLDKDKYFIVGGKYWQYHSMNESVPEQYVITFIRGRYFFFKWLERDEPEKCVHMDTLFALTSEPEEITLPKEFEKFTNFVSKFHILKEKEIKPKINFE